jgi:hypothetical protein
LCSGSQYQQRNRAPCRVEGRASLEWNHKFHGKSSAEPAGHFDGLCLSLKRCNSAKDVCKSCMGISTGGILLVRTGLTMFGSLRFG